MTTGRTETFGKSRFLTLDFLRGVAALIVAIGHAGFLSRSFSLLHSLDFGMCVSFFFILFGYVLTHAYGEAIRTRRMTWRGFIKVRFARLYSLHLLTAGVMILVLTYTHQLASSLGWACLRH